MKTKNTTAAAAASVDVDRWQVERRELMARLGPRFARRESFGHACDLVTGMMSGLPRRNCWTIGEHVGDPPAVRVAEPALAGVVGHDGVRDDMRDYVVEPLGDPGGVLVADETGDLKKGTATVGCSANTPAPPGGSKTLRWRDGFGNSGCTLDLSIEICDGASNARQIRRVAHGE